MTAPAVATEPDFVAARYEIATLRAEWSVMARACGNYRDFGAIELTPEVKARRQLITDEEYRVAAAAIVRVHELEAALARLQSAPPKDESTATASAGYRFDPTNNSVPYDQAGYVEAPPKDAGAPTARKNGECCECGCATGGSIYCYDHAPYTVMPKGDGTFLVDRYGQRKRVSYEPPDPDPSASGPASQPETKK